jgi:hypothetical protein
MPAITEGLLSTPTVVSADDGLGMSGPGERWKKQPAHWSTTLCDRFDFHQTQKLNVGAQ